MSFIDLAGIMDALRSSIGAAPDPDDDDYEVELDLTEKLKNGPLDNNWIIAHFFTLYLRDYVVLVDVLATSLDDTTFILARYSYRFTHCVLAEVDSALDDRIWKSSWEDELIKSDAWEKSEKAEGYYWGSNAALARPGLKYLPGSPLSREWTKRLEKPMNEVYIESTVHNIGLVFHDVEIKKIARGNPATGQLTPIKESPEDWL